MSNGDSAVPDLSMRVVATPAVRRMLIGLAATSLGGGLTLALFVVYLHQIRGLSLQTAGLVLTYQALLGLGLAPLVGTLVDRIGPKPILMVACGTEAVATAAFGFVTTVPQAVAVATVLAIGTAGLWAPQSALLARLVPPQHRQRVFGLQFMLLNLGLGIGGLAAALILDSSRPTTFTVMYVINGCSYLIYLVVIATLRGVSGPEEHDVGDSTGGYREVLSDVRLRRYLIGALVLLTCGYGSVDAGLPVFMTTVAHLPVNAIGLVFAFNTLLIVVAQVWVLRRIEGRSRTAMLALAAVLWSTLWIAVALSSAFSPVVAGVLIALGFGVFAFGEMIFSPIGPTLINAFSPPQLRGRYNAMGGLIWGLAGGLGPAVAGVVIGGGWGVAWALGLALGCAIAGVILRSLRGLLTEEEDGKRRPCSGDVREVGV